MKRIHVFGSGLLVTLGSVFSMAAAAQEPAGRDRPDNLPAAAGRRRAAGERGAMPTSG